MVAEFSPLAVIVVYPELYFVISENSRGFVIEYDSEMTNVVIAPVTNIAINKVSNFENINSYFVRNEI